MSQQPIPELIYTGYTTEAWPEVVDWCEKNIGEWNQDWYKLGEDAAAQIVFPDYRGTYLFRTEQQLLAFTLKWS
jgi:hypothetical protein